MSTIQNSKFKLFALLSLVVCTVFFIGTSFNINENRSLNVKSLQDVTLTNPINGASNVPVNTSISWTPSNVAGVTGYILNIGTSSGGNDIANNLSVGLATSYTPPLGLPENSTIYVTISLFFLNAPSLPCPEESFTTEDVTSPPLCTLLTTPTNGQTEVPVGTIVRWSPAISAEGYRISIGTSPGGSDIENNLTLGNILSFIPSSNLPENTPIFVTVTPFNSNGDALTCLEESFTTAATAELPGCTNLISPIDGETSVPLSRILQWNAVGNATGYRMTVGSTPFDDDILSNADLGNVTSISFLNFVANSFVFVTITPYNDAGSAIGCLTESFTTILGCGPFLDPVTGELVFLGPTLDFPSQVGICLNEIPTVVNTDAMADGYRWFSIAPDGSELLVSSTASFEIFREGEYRLEVFNIIDGSSLECINEQVFTVITSEAPEITAIDLESISATQGRATVQVNGSGDYEYALNNSNGPYQVSPIFDIDLTEANTIYVRDRNGCGIAERFLNTGFPNFFTPNGDNFNDVWEIPGAVIDGEPIVHINIFDRFGKLIKQLAPNEGWDGTYVGNPMPTSDYWYSIQVESGKIFRGHFALKR